jgi:glycerol-3-phosphate dehydrogenase (NAD(P)+)
MSDLQKVCVLGAGSWGTALGVAAYNAGRDVVLWNIEEEVVTQINDRHINPLLGDIVLPDTMVATTDLSKALDVDIIMVTVPAQIVRPVMEQLKSYNVDKNIPFVICCKGIEISSLKLVSQVIAEYFPNPVAVLSGPNFADEVAKSEPAGTTLACADAVLGEALVNALGSQRFRTYQSTDIIGAQIGGSIKNVIAIACGISSGKGFGENTKVTLVTRGLLEMGHMCVALGGRHSTLLGMCGVGDMMLTCGTQKSRNMSFGYALGQGKSVDELLKENKTVEGIATAKSVHALAQKHQLDMPITDAVYRIVHEHQDIDQTIQWLLQRPLTSEDMA